MAASGHGNKPGKTETVQATRCAEAGVLVRIKGQAPVAATVYALEKLRCNLCQKVYTAEAPAEAGEKKYDETAAAMIALLRYGSGFPWYRLKGLEAGFGIPLPVATQCEIVAEIAPTVRPALEELIRQAAEGGVMHNDDTSMRVLSLGRNRVSDAEVSPERTGVFTSGIVSIRGGRRIALFFTGRKHAGTRTGPVTRGPSPFPPRAQCACNGKAAYLAKRTVRGKERGAELRSRQGDFLSTKVLGLTLFLRQANAPLDNNIAERGLKKAILHRKNSLFYRTRNGARMGDLFMSLIHTCELNGANPFDYLTELQRHAEDLKADPAEWLPWNYRATLARLAVHAA